MDGWMEVEYKAGSCGIFGTKYMSVSLTVFEIQNINTYTYLEEKEIDCF